MHCVGEEIAFVGMTYVWDTLIGGFTYDILSDYRLMIEWLVLENASSLSDDALCTVRSAYADWRARMVLTYLRTYSKLHLL